MCPILYKKPDISPSEALNDIWEALDPKSIPPTEVASCAGSETVLTTAPIAWLTSSEMAVSLPCE